VDLLRDLPWPPRRNPKELVGTLCSPERRKSRIGRRWGADTGTGRRPSPGTTLPGAGDKREGVTEREVEP